MGASERLRAKMDDIEREIEEIEDYKAMLDLCPKPGGVWRLSHDIRVYIIKRDLERRAHFLRMNRSSAYACHRHVGERSRPVA